LKDEKEDASYLLIAGRGVDGVETI